MDKLSNRSTSPQAYKAYLRKQAQDQLKEFKPQTLDVQDISPIVVPQEAMQSMQRVGSGEAGRESQASILGADGPITQRFGNKNAIERFSNGINTGTDFGTPVGTKLALPPGRWKVLQAFAGDQKPGFIGNNVNSGYGNSVLVQNAETGEKLRFSHLSDVGVEPGQELDGNQVIGATGASGNVTGPHLDLEYYDKLGKIADVMNSIYSQYLRMGGQNG